MKNSWKTNEHSKQEGRERLLITMIMVIVFFSSLSFSLSLYFSSFSFSPYLSSFFQRKRENDSQFVDDDYDDVSTTEWVHWKRPESAPSSTMVCFSFLIQVQQESWRRDKRERERELTHIFQIGSRRNRNSREERERERERGEGETWQRVKVFCVDLQGKEKWRFGIQMSMDHVVFFQLKPLSLSLCISSSYFLSLSVFLPLTFSLTLLSLTHSPLPHSLSDQKWWQGNETDDYRFRLCVRNMFTGFNLMERNSKMREWERKKSGEKKRMKKETSSTFSLSWINGLLPHM